MPAYLGMLHALQQAAEHDPLGADAIFDVLPQNAGDPGWLATQLSALSVRADGLRGADACAAVRDLGMLAGALQRHGCSPIAAVPALAEILPSLCGSGPPRDTILHYTVANPDGPRQRTFTGTPEERALIRAVRAAVASVYRAAWLLGGLARVPLPDPIVAPMCRNIAAHLSGLVDGVARSRAAVPPVFFAQTMRLFFEPIEIDGVAWEGPGAVQLPVWLIDHLLWQAGGGDPVLAAYQEERLRYSPELRPLVSHGAEHGALLQRAIESGDAETMAQVDALMTTMLRFRMPHRTIARKAYAAEAGNPRAVGSGGHGVTLLERLADATLQARARLRDARARSERGLAAVG